MENPPHIVIIGAGLIGLSSADHLMDRGARVTLLERHSGPGEGAGFCNSGMIHPSQATPWFGPKTIESTQHITDLARRSRELLAIRMKALGLACSSRPSGTVQLFGSPSEGLRAKENYETLDIDCEDVTGSAFTFGRYALRFPNDRSGNAYLYSQTLAADLIRRGARIIYDACENTVIHETKAADHVIIAAGAQSASVAKTFGIDLPISPAVGHALNFKRPDMDLPAQPIMHHASHSALTTFKDHVRLSGTLGEDSPNALIGIWEEIAPDLLDAFGDPIVQWSGDRPMSALGRPIIGHSGQANIWVNTGHAHMGWTLSAGSGELIAGMIIDGEMDERFRLL